MYFTNTFDNLSKENIDLLNTYFDSYPYESSAHTYLANYMWRKTHNISWQIIGKYLVIESYGTLETEEEEHFMSFPLTNTGNYDINELKNTIDEGKRIFESNGSELEMSLIPKSLVHYLEEIYGDKIEIEHDRDDDEYIYDRNSLESLSGRKLHQKKNHLNYFHDSFEFSYEEITSENVEEVREFIHSKNKFIFGETPEEYKEILELETEAVDEALDLISCDNEKKSESTLEVAKMAKERFLGGAIRIDGKIVAACFGEYSNLKNKDTVIVHVEKADDRIRGLYQAINNEFVKHLPESVKFLNREEDMGMENLRKTKESYHPVKMAEKYSAWFK